MFFALAGANMCMSRNITSLTVLAVLVLFQNRGATHRHVAYKKFQKQGFYTLTLDYRGYGDSKMSSELNMTSVVQDAVVALK